MKSFLIAASTAATLAPVAMPSAALALDHGRREVRQEQRECSRELRRADSRREYQRELNECRREIAKEQRETRRDHRQAARDWRRYSNYDWNRYEPGQSRYYADRYYRSGTYYADRRLSYNDRIYRGYNGNYYCRRDDGTTGLIIGAGVGALLGNQVNVGGSRTLNTIIGGAAGAALGHAIDKGNVRCD